MENICYAILCFDSEELFVEVGIHIDQRFIFCEKLGAGWGKPVRIILSSKLWSLIETVKLQTYTSL